MVEEEEEDEAVAVALRAVDEGLEEEEKEEEEEEEETTPNGPPGQKDNIEAAKDPLSWDSSVWSLRIRRVEKVRVCARETKRTNKRTKNHEQRAHHLNRFPT